MIEVALRRLPDFSSILAVDWLVGVTSRVDAGLDGVASVAAAIDEDGCLIYRSLMVASLKF